MEAAATDLRMYRPPLLKGGRESQHLMARYGLATRASERLPALAAKGHVAPDDETMSGSRHFDGDLLAAHIVDDGADIDLVHHAWYLGDLDKLLSDSVPGHINV